ncbi:MAG: Dipeptidyl-peptidase 5 [Cryomorphaceae bacterium]|nr:MAG: Dipeptidyl-peptidase 5 [Cryomorphaceae bacterium]
MKKILLLAAIAAVSCQNSPSEAEADGASGATWVSELNYEGEDHFYGMRQLTDGGDNAEAYFSFDGSQLTFQSNAEKWGNECDQIYAFDWNQDTILEEAPARISNGLGRTTCAYFMPGDTTILYASTFTGDSACPAVPERGEGGAYVWPIYEDFDIYVSDLEGNLLDTLISGPGYDAEATVSPDGTKIVFTSTRSGDLELYVCDIDGSNIVQVTSGLGYDGGAFFSPDSKKLVFRSSRPTSEEEVEKYKDLLAQGLVEPTEMELYTCNIDGSELTQVTQLGQANWAPYYHPSGEKIVFSSNHHSERGFPFNLFMINTDGTGLQQISFDTAFDSFPMFSPDGKKLVFASNRNNGGGRATNLFIVDWKE